MRRRGDYNLHMNKGLGLFIVGVLAVIGGAAFVALLIRSKFLRVGSDYEEEFFEDDDTEFDEFFGDSELPDELNELEDELPEDFPEDEAHNIPVE